MKDYKSSDIQNKKGGIAKRTGVITLTAIASFLANGCITPGYVSVGNQEERTPAEIEAIAKEYSGPVQNKHAKRIMELGGKLKKLERGESPELIPLENRIKGYQTSIDSANKDIRRMNSDWNQSKIHYSAQISECIESIKDLEKAVKDSLTEYKDRNGRTKRKSDYRKCRKGMKAIKRSIAASGGDTTGITLDYYACKDSVFREIGKIHSAAGDKTDDKVPGINVAKNIKTAIENRIEYLKEGRKTVEAEKDLFITGKEGEITDYKNEIGKLQGRVDSLSAKLAIENKKQITSAKEKLRLSHKKKAEDLAKVAKKIGYFPVRVAILNKAIGTYQKAYDLTKNEEDSQRKQELINFSIHPKDMGKGSIFASFLDYTTKPFVALGSLITRDGKPSVAGEYKPTQFIDDVVDPKRGNNEVITGGMTIDNSQAQQNFTNPTETVTEDGSAYKFKGEAAINSWLVGLAMNRRTDNEKIQGYIFDWKARDWVPDTQESQTKIMEILAGAGYKGKTQAAGLNVEWYALTKLGTTEKEHSKEGRRPKHTDSKKFGGESYLAVVFDKGRGEAIYFRMNGGGDYIQEIAVSAERELVGGTKAKLEWAHQTNDEQKAARKTEKKNIIRTLLMYNGKQLPGFLKGTNLHMGVDFEVGSEEGKTNNYDFRTGFTTPEIPFLGGTNLKVDIHKYRNIDPSQRLGPRNNYGRGVNINLIKQIRRK